MLRHVKRMPRTAGVIVWTAGAVATYAVVPFELSQLGDRARPQGPAASAARGAGLLTVTAGAALMTWAMAAHYHAAPRGWALDSQLTPEYLLRRGPYRFSRNPIYAGEAIVWLGWALYYRHPAVWAGLAIQCAASTKITRWEERRLLTRFGDDYRAYLEEVPRWAPRSPNAQRTEGHLPHVLPDNASPPPSGHGIIVTAGNAKPVRRSQTGTQLLGCVAHQVSLGTESRH
jgi:protein-S-isoprenylcysteine O-methyltransferase Ste14